MKAKKNKKVFVFQKQVVEIFGRIGNARDWRRDYDEDRDAHTVTFALSEGGVTFDQLQRLSVLLGTKDIDFECDEGPDDYYGQWLSGIRAENVVFPAQ